MHAAAAHHLHNDRGVQELFAALRAEYLDDFARCQVQDTERMQRIRMQIDSLDSLRSRIAGLAADHEPQGT